jgi:hypothetical protein
MNGLIDDHSIIDNHSLTDERSITDVWFNFPMRIIGDAGPGFFYGVNTLYL